MATRSFLARLRAYIEARSFELTASPESLGKLTAVRQWRTIAERNPLARSGDHTIAASLASLAIMYHDQGDFINSEVAIRRLLADRPSILGRNKPVFELDQESRQRFGWGAFVIYGRSEQPLTEQQKRVYRAATDLLPQHGIPTLGIRDRIPGFILSQRTDAPTGNEFLRRYDDPTHPVFLDTLLERACTISNTMNTVLQPYATVFYDFEAKVREAIESGGVPLTGAGKETNAAIASAYRAHAERDPIVHTDCCIENLFVDFMTLAPTARHARLASNLQEIDRYIGQADWDSLARLRQHPTVPSALAAARADLPSLAQRCIAADFETCCRYTHSSVLAADIICRTPFSLSLQQETTVRDALGVAGITAGEVGRRLRLAHACRKEYPHLEESAARALELFVDDKPLDEYSFAGVARFLNTHADLVTRRVSP